MDTLHQTYLSKRTKTYKKKMDPSDTTEENKTDFNHLQSKYTYLGLLELYYSTSTFEEKRDSFHMVKDIERKDLLKKNAIIKKNTPDLKYDIKGEGEDVVILTVQNNEQTLEILSFENIYEILIKLHVDNNHNNESLKNATNDKYRIPDICFDLLQEACNVCKEEHNNSCAGRTGIVTFIQQMSLKSSAYHNALLIYVDKYTEFIIIRPIKSYDVDDMVTELFKIFMELGTPQTVHMYLNKMSSDISIIMNRLCPSCDILFDYQDDKQKLTLRVLDALGKWMRETNSNSWEIGCSIVQRQLNTEVRATHPKTQTPVTAHDLFFKNPSIFNNVGDFASRWFYTKPVETTSDLKEQSNTDITFVCATQNEILVQEEQDPLATDVANLNIQSEPESPILSILETNSQHIEPDNYCEVMKETPKLNKKKTRTKKFTTHKTLSDSEEESLMSTRDKEENETSSNEGFLTTVIINALHDKKTTKTRIKKNNRHKKIKKKTIKTLNSKITASTSAAGKERDETDLNDYENITIDFGAEEGQVIDIKIANTEGSTNGTDKERCEENLHDNENINFGCEEVQVIGIKDIKIANIDASTSATNKRRYEGDLHDNGNIINDLGAEECQILDTEENKIANTEVLTNKEDLDDDDSSIIDFGAEI